MTLHWMLPVVLFWGLSGLLAASQKPFVFNMGFEPQSVQAQFQTRIAREAFLRLGIPTEFVRVPAERALLHLNEGIEDGNLIRVAGLSRIYPNIVQIPVKIVDYDFVVITRDPAFQVTGWDSFADLDVAIVTGWKILESNIRKYASLTKVKDGEQLFGLLQSGRVDAVVYERMQARMLMREADCVQGVIHEPPLATREMYFYVNKAHSGLAPQVAKTLEAMKLDGSYGRIYQDVFGESLQP